MAGIPTKRSFTLSVLIRDKKFFTEGFEAHRRRYGRRHRHREAIRGCRGPARANSHSLHRGAGRPRRSGTQIMELEIPYMTL